MSDPDYVLTTIHHDTEYRKYITGFSAVGSYIQYVDYYGVTTTQLKALKEQSVSCEQFVSVECFGVSSGLLYDYWLNIDGERVSWQTDDEQCTCSLDRACTHNHTGSASSLHLLFHWMYTI